MDQDSTSTSSWPYGVAASASRSRRDTWYNIASSLLLHSEVMLLLPGPELPRECGPPAAGKHAPKSRRAAAAAAAAAA